MPLVFLPKRGDNLENLNAHFIADGLERSERLPKLNGIAIRQMQLLTDDSGVKRLDGKIV